MCLYERTTTTGLVLELVLKRQRSPDATPPHALVRMIRESLGSGARYAEWMRPEGAAAAAGGGDNGQQQQDDGAAAAAAAEGEAAADGEAAAAAAADGEGAGEQEGESAGAGEQAEAAAAGAGDASQEGGEEELRFLVRFSTPEDATAALAAFEAAAEGGEAKQVAGHDATLRAVEGEEEEAYHKRVGVFGTVVVVVVGLLQG